jgi:hypothetical protein
VLLAENHDPALKPIGELMHRKLAKSCGRESDREGYSVHGPTDPQNGLGIFLSDAKFAIYCLGTL